MALKTYAELQTLLSQDVMGQHPVWGQAMLDLLESQMRVMGAMEMQAGPDLIAPGGAWEVLDVYDTVLFQENVTMDHTTGVVTLDPKGEGFYQINFIAHMIANGNITIEVAFAKTGVTPTAGLPFDLKNNEGLVLTAGFLEQFAAADQCAVLIRQTAGVGTTTVDAAALDLFRVG